MSLSETAGVDGCGREWGSQPCGRKAVGSEYD